MPDPAILTEAADGIARLTFNRPEARNAITGEMWREVPDLLDKLHRDPSLRVLVLTGAGGEAFAAGADIAELETLRDAGGVREYHGIVEDAMRALEATPLVSIAMINGAAVGGGLEVALACDLRLASDGAVFGIPAGKLGWMVEAHNIGRLVSLVGPGAAKELLLTGRLLDARRAYEIGLVSAVFPRDRLEAEVRALAREIAGRAPAALLWIKRAVGRVVRAQGAALTEAGAFPWGEGAGARDLAEGIAAFLEKRAPQFDGR